MYISDLSEETLDAFGRKAGFIEPDEKITQIILED